MSIEGLSITLANRTLPLVEIERLDSAGFSSAEQNAISFCRSWMRGQSHFDLLTSGSTGQPKTIRIHRDQMIASARLTQGALGLNAGMTSLVCLDAKYIAGQMMLVRSLVIGMNMIVVDPVANPLAALHEEAVVDVTAMIPYQVKSALVSTDRSRLNQLKNVLIGGGEVHADLEGELKEFTPAFYATYGMTETISHIALRRLNKADDAFTALPGIQLAMDHRGCLSIQANYLGSEPIVTNDLVELLGPANFRWLGRVDFVINTGGIKVIPEKTEKAISKVIAVCGKGRRYFVHGFPHEVWGQQVTLVVEGEQLSDAEEASLQEAIKKQLSKYEQPKRIVYVPRFIETSTGKIDRNLTASLASPPPLSE